MIVKWTKKSNNTTFDITKVVGTISWSGSVTQAARQASITVLHEIGRASCRERV